MNEQQNTKLGKGIYLTKLFGLIQLGLSTQFVIFYLW